MPNLSEQKLNQILSSLEDIKNKKKSKLQLFLDFCEKLILPGVLGFSVWSVSVSNYELSKKQVNNQDAQSQVQQAQFERSIEAKYLELIYKDITGKDKERIDAAVNFLDYAGIKTSIADNFASAVIQSENASDDAQDKAVEIKKSIELIGNLFNYNIGIYFLEGRSDLNKKANTIKSELIEYGFQDNKIAIYPKDNNFFNRVDTPSDDQIRYEPIIEEEDAQELQKILQKVYPENSFRRQTIRGTTRNFMSIFLKP